MTVETKPPYKLYNATPTNRLRLKGVRLQQLWYGSVASQQLPPEYEGVSSLLEWRDVPTVDEDSTDFPQGRMW